MEDNNEDIIVECIKGFLEAKIGVITPYSRKDGNKVKDENFIYDIYNECSLQHELGIWLREKLKSKNKIEYKVYFEKNIYKFLNLEDSKIEELFPKRKCSDVDNQNKPKCEVDLVIIGKEKEEIKEKYAIELKFPINGQYPQQMKKFKEDIKFMKQLYKAWKEKDNTTKDIKMNTYCLTLANDDKFYKRSGREETSGNKVLYYKFRTFEENLDESFEESENSDKTDIPPIIWNTLNDNIKFYLIDIGKNKSVKFKLEEPSCV